MYNKYSVINCYKNSLLLRASSCKNTRGSNKLPAAQEYNNFKKQQKGKLAMTNTSLKMYTWQIPKGRVHGK